MGTRRPYLIYYLIMLVALVKSRDFTRVSTREFGAAAGISQQNAAKVLVALERAGYIERKIVKNVTYVRLTDLAIRELEAIREVVERVVPSRRPSFKLIGRVFTGLGEGAYYLSLRGYREPIKKLVGFDPYPGTLNLRADDSETKVLLAWLRSLPGLVVPGFSDEKRKYGSAKIFKCKVEDRVSGAIIFAARTHYGPDVFEVIAPVYLRGLLNLKDGDKVTVTVYIT